MHVVARPCAAVRPCAYRAVCAHACRRVCAKQDHTGATSDPSRDCCPIVCQSCSVPLACSSPSPDPPSLATPPSSHPPTSTHITRPSSHPLDHHRPPPLHTHHPQRITFPHDKPSVSPSVALAMFLSLSQSLRPRLLAPRRVSYTNSYLLASQSRSCRPMPCSSLEFVRVSDRPIVLIRRLTTAHRHGLCAPSLRSVMHVHRGPLHRD